MWLSLSRVCIQKNFNWAAIKTHLSEYVFILRIQEKWYSPPFGAARDIIKESSNFIKKHQLAPPLWRG